MKIVKLLGIIWHYFINTVKKTYVFSSFSSSLKLWIVTLAEANATRRTIRRKRLNILNANYINPLSSRNYTILSALIGTVRFSYIICCCIFTAYLPTFICDWQFVFVHYNSNSCLLKTMKRNVSIELKINSNCINIGSDKWQLIQTIM